MKLGKTSLLLIIAGIVIIAFASLGIARVQRLNEQDQVDEELSVATLRLERFQLEYLHSQQEELENQRGQITSELETIRATLSQVINSIGATDALFNIARTCSVEVTEITSSNPVDGELQEIPSSVLTVNVTVEGSLPNLVRFIITVNNDFVIGTVQSAQIEVPEPAEEEMPSARISLLVYTYRGD